MTICFAMTGSFCTLERALSILPEVRDTFGSVIPLFSETAAGTDTRFGRAADFVRRAEELCGRSAVVTSAGAEPLGPKGLAEALLVAPCTGNTLAKLAAGVNDTAVTMAAKSLLRNDRPVVLALSTNDGLGASARSLGELLTRRNIYFVPFAQDDPVKKPRSLAADLSLSCRALTAALEGRQLQPILA